MKAFREALTYDDVLLVPAYSTIVPAETSLETHLHHITLQIPFLSAPMDTVTESSLAITLGEEGGMGVIHKNMSAKQQAAEVQKVSKKKTSVGAAVSVGDEQFERAMMLVKAGATMLVVDSAHGHSKGVLDQVQRLKKKYKNHILIVGGNVATKEGTLALIQAGADIVKVGIGPGSICTTRIIAGVGVPQLTAVIDAVSAAKKTKTPIIADGGIKYSGDIVKALAAGASAIMAGGLFAGTKESPGKTIMQNGEKMKVYRGMGSEDAMIQGSKDRYGQKEVTEKKKLVPEGVVGYTPYKGSVKEIIQQLAGGVQAGMGYLGSKNIQALQKNAVFVRITQSGMKESHPHTLSAIKKTKNYS